MAFTAFWILNTQESLFIYPMRRPDLDRLISCYTPILVGRFIFHLFNKAVDFAGAHLTEGPSFNFCFCKSKALSPFLVAITQVTYNFLDLCLLIHFWLLGFFFLFFFQAPLCMLFHILPTITGFVIEDFLGYLGCHIT